MIDEEEESGGKIDWTIAIVLSVAFHAAILGAVWMFSDKPGSKADVHSEEKIETKTESAEPATPPSVHETAPEIREETRTESNPSPVQESAPSPKFGTYVVKAGDNLSRIANKCGCTLAELKQMNDIKDANSIRPGQKLKVPAEE